jgi:hypothetical protein
MSKPLRKPRKPPPVAYYDPVDKPQPERQVTAWATERLEWTAERVDGALYLQIDMLRTGYSVAYRPQGAVRGRCAMAVGEPPQSLLDLCLAHGVPVVDLSVAGFSLSEWSGLLGDDTGNYPEYGGDMDLFLEKCRMAGAQVDACLNLAEQEQP